MTESGLDPQDTTMTLLNNKTMMQQMPHEPLTEFQNTSQFGGQDEFQQTL